MPLSHFSQSNLHTARVEGSVSFPARRVVNNSRALRISEVESLLRFPLAVASGSRTVCSRAASCKSGAVNASAEPVAHSCISRYQYSSVQQHVDQISVLLGLSGRSVNNMANKQPALLSMTTAEIAAQFEGVQRSLHLPPTEARELVRSYPHLLVMSKGTLDRTLQRLQTHLRVPRATLGLLVAKQPFLLQASAESLEAKVDALGLALNANRDQVMVLVSRMPELLLICPERVAENVKQLCVILGLPPADVLEVAMQYPPLLLRNSELTTHYVHLIANFMDVPVPQAVALIVKRPEVLGVSWSILKENFEKVCTYFGDISREKVIVLVVSNPSLLPLLQDDSLHQHHS